MMRWEIWRYLPGGKVKHALRYAGAHKSQCGMGTRLGGDWYGTGSQLEYEENERRPACKRCLALGYRP